MKQKPSLSAVFFTLAAALVCYFVYTVLSAIMGGNCLA